MYSQFGKPKPQNRENENLEKFPWYFGSINRDEAETYLYENGENQGTFLIRDGPVVTKHGITAKEYRLSMLVWEREANKCKAVHCEIIFDFAGNYYLEPDICCSTISEIVEHYSKHEDIDKRLTTFCPRHHLEMVYEPLPNRWEVEVNSVICSEKLSGNLNQSCFVWLGKMYSKTVVVKRQRDPLSLELKRHLSAEAIALAELQHTNIVKLLGIISESPYSIILEYAEKRDLLNYVLGFNIYEIAFSQVLKFSQQIATALKYVSEKGYVHRNVRACNVLLSKELDCKLAGFGYVKKVNEIGNYFVKDDDRPFPQIMYHWMALEAFKENRFTTKSDVWSLAVTVHELFTKGERPYAECFAPTLMKKITSGYRLKRSLGMTSEVYQLLQACWAEVEETRPTFDQIIDHMEAYRTNKTPKNPITFSTWNKTLRYSAFSKVKNWRRRFIAFALNYTLALYCF